MRGHLTPGEAGEHARRAPACARLVLTHISDELDDVLGPHARPSRRFGGPVELAREGAVYELVGSWRMPRNATSSPTSSACAARWTSCSATSSSARWGRATAAASRPRSTSSTSGDPPRAVVHAELAGIDPDEIGLEIEGRELVIAGHRRPPTPRAASTSSSRSTSARSGATIQLGADVVADAGQGHLRRRDPARRAAARARREPRTRADRRARRSRTRASDRRSTDAGEGQDVAIGAARALPGDAAGAAAARDRPVPRHADAAGGRPGALDRSSSTTCSPATACS